MMTTTSFKLPPLQSSDAIRILEIQPGAASDKLTCVFHVQNLQQSHEYDALSYCWSDQSCQTVKGLDLTLWSDGVPVPLSKTVQHAIYRLRHFDKSRFLWIDSVCINQMDLDEKSTQVQMMRYIYRKAARVIVWLGEDDGNAFEALELIAQIAAVSIGRERPNLQEHDLDKAGDHNPTSFGLPQFSDRRWEALTSIFARPWFRRVWVIQEVVVAQRVHLLYGTHGLDWEDIDLSISFMSRLGKSGWITSLQNRVNTKHFISGFEATAQIRRLRKDFDKKEKSLLSLLRQTNVFRATDPRDKVFALVGLAYLQDDPYMTKAAEIDYTISVADLFRHITIASINQDQNLSVLSLLAPPTMALPSWVPDFSAWRKPIKLSDRYKAAFNTKFARRIGFDSELLCLDGLYFDAIKSVAEETFTGTLMTELTLCSWAIKTRQWLPSIYPTGVSREEAFWRAVVGNNGPRTTRSPPGFQKYPVAAEFGDLLIPYLVHYFVSHGADQTSPILSWLNGFDEIHGGPKDPMEYYGKYKPEYLSWFASAYKRAAKNRRFFVTKNGYMGLGPLEVEPTDHVFILAGADVPFLLRPPKEPMDDYRILGECYVHGVMNGEAMNGDPHWREIYID